MNQPVSPLSSVSPSGFLAAATAPQRSGGLAEVHPDPLVKALVDMPTFKLFRDDALRTVLAQQAHRRVEVEVSLSIRVNFSESVASLARL